MRVCPRCSGPFSGKDGAILASKELYCDRCSWEGSSAETIIVDDALANLDGFQGQLELLYVGLAKQISPLIGKLLIETGMVVGPDGESMEKDQQRIHFLARVLEGSTRGAIQGIASTIAEEMNHGGN